MTGAAGIIGSTLIRGMLSANAQAEREALELRRVVNLDALTYAGNPAYLDSIRQNSLYRTEHGNITNAALLERVLREHEITSVIHLSVESPIDRAIEDPDRIIRTSVWRTYRLLVTIRRLWLGKTRNRFLHISTDRVFCFLGPKDPPLTKATPNAPNRPYAASKADGDHLARVYFQTYGLPVLTSNCSNNDGPRQFPEKLIPLIILNVLESKTLPAHGDGG